MFIHLIIRFELYRVSSCQIKVEEEKNYEEELKTLKGSEQDR